MDKYMDEDIDTDMDMVNEMAKDMNMSNEMTKDMVLDSRHGHQTNPKWSCGWCEIVAERQYS